MTFTFYVNRDKEEGVSQMSTQVNKMSKYGRGMYFSFSAPKWVGRVLKNQPSREEFLISGNKELKQKNLKVAKLHLFSLNTGLCILIICVQP